MLAVAIAPDGSWLASAGDLSDSSVRLWDIETGKLRAILKGHTGEVAAVAITPDGGLLATAGGAPHDGTVRLWDPAAGAPRAVLAGHDGGVRTVAISQDGNLLASVSSRGTIRVWDTHRGEAAMRVDSRLNTCSISPDGRMVAACCEKGVCLFEYRRMTMQAAH